MGHKVSLILGEINLRNWIYVNVNEYLSLSVIKVNIKEGGPEGKYWIILAEDRVQ
jgi:hypothetical protein